jgi:hypothetical protein
MFFTINMLIIGWLKLNINILICIDAVIWIMMNILISNRVQYLRSINDPTALKFTDLGTSYKFKRRRRRN